MLKSILNFFGAEIVQEEKKPEVIYAQVEKKPETTEPVKKAYKGPGTRVKELREAKGWTQQNLATIVGCQRRFISSIETGSAQEIDVELALKIENTFHTNIWTKVSNK